MTNISASTASAMLYWKTPFQQLLIKSYSISPAQAKQHHESTCASQSKGRIPLIHKSLLWPLRKSRSSVKVVIPKNGTTQPVLQNAPARKRKHKLHKNRREKRFPGSLLIIRYTIEKVLTDENIDRIASRVIQLAEKEFNDKTLLHNLRQQQKDIDKRIAKSSLCH